MKKLLIIFATLLLSICFIFGTTVFVSAEEYSNTQIETETPKLPSTDEIIDTMGGNLTEEEKSEIKELVDKIEKYTESSDSFFIRNIVPIIVAIAVCCVIGLIVLVPYLRDKLKLRDSENMLKNAKTQISGYKAEIEELKKQLNTDSIKNDIKDFIKKQWESIGLMIEDTLKKNGVEIDKIESCVQALINGAINAWHGSPEAIACLTTVASATELKNLAEENAKLTALVYKKYGEEASKEINGI